MSTNITSRVAIRARIAEWQRQQHNSDYGPTHSFFWNDNAQAERVRWFRQA
jgi:hypothetical protein